MASARASDTCLAPNFPGSIARGAAGRLLRRPERATPPCRLRRRFGLLLRLPTALVQPVPVGNSPLQDTPTLSRSCHQEGVSSEEEESGQFLSDVATQRTGDLFEIGASSADSSYEARGRYDSSDLLSAPDGDTCQPDCDGRECGSDGCGGSCGSCPCSTCAEDEYYCDLSTGQCYGEVPLCQDIWPCFLDCGLDAMCAQQCWKNEMAEVQGVYNQLMSCLHGNGYWDCGATEEHAMNACVSLKLGACATLVPPCYEAGHADCPTIWSCMSTCGESDPGNCAACVLQASWEALDAWNSLALCLVSEGFLACTGDTGRSPGCCSEIGVSCTTELENCGLSGVPCE